MPRKTNSKESSLRVYAFAIAALLVIIGISAYGLMNSNQSTQKQSIKTTNSNDVYSNISSKDIINVTTNADTLWNGNDPYYGYDKVPIVALVHIDSIEGGRTFSPISKQWVYPQTFGRMTVREVYKGDVKPGELLAYYRLGATVTFDDYWKSLSQQEQDKILQLNGGKKPSEKYVQEKFTDDIDIKASKDYVVFLIPQSSEDRTSTEYMIDGLQYGLREAKGSGSEVSVLNNNSKKWENISKVVKAK